MLEEFENIVFKVFDKIPFKVQTKDGYYPSKKEVENILTYAFSESNISKNEIEYIYTDNKYFGFGLTVCTYKDVEILKERVQISIHLDTVDDKEPILISVQYFKGNKKKQNTIKQTTNIVKQTTKELGITQKKLAQRMGVSEVSLSRWAKGEIIIPKWALNMIELLKTEKKYNDAKNKFKELDNIFN